VLVVGSGAGVSDVTGSGEGVVLAVGSGAGVSLVVGSGLAVSVVTGSGVEWSAARAGVAIATGIAIEALTSLVRSFTCSPIAQVCGSGPSARRNEGRPASDAVLSPSAASWLSVDSLAVCDACGFVSGTIGRCSGAIKALVTTCGLTLTFRKHSEHGPVGNPGGSVREHQYSCHVPPKRRASRHDAEQFFAWAAPNCESPPVRSVGPDGGGSPSCGGPIRRSSDPGGHRWC
jgi:hypothetical protein